MFGKFWKYNITISCAGEHETFYCPNNSLSFLRPEEHLLEDYIFIPRNSTIKRWHHWFSLYEINAPLGPCPDLVYLRNVRVVSSVVKLIDKYHVTLSRWDSILKLLSMNRTTICRLNSWTIAQKVQRLVIDNFLWVKRTRRTNKWVLLLALILVTNK